MGNGYDRGGGTDLFSQLSDQFAALKRQMSELQSASGTQLTDLVAQVKAKLAELDTTVNALVAAALGNYYTKAQTDSKVANPGAIFPSTVNASGMVTFPAGVNSTDVYNRLLTYGGGYKNQYIHVDGSMGYVPSSKRFKQDIKTFEIPPELAAKLRVVTFRYIAAVQNPDYVAATEVGLIAEEVHSLGLTWLVDYDEEGMPMGVKYERLVLALVPWMQSIEARLKAAGI